MRQAEKRKPLRRIKIGKQIQIGFRAIVTARDRPKQPQMHDPRGPQLRLVGAQLFQDGLLLHD